MLWGHSFCDFSFVRVSCLEPSDRVAWVEKVLDRPRGVCAG